MAEIVLAETSIKSSHKACHPYNPPEDLRQPLQISAFSPELPALASTSQTEGEVQVFQLITTAPVTSELSQVELLPGDALELVAAPGSELVVVSPPVEEKRRKIKRARVVKDIQTVEIENAEEGESPLQKEQAKLGESVRRFVARTRDVQGDRQFSKWKGSVIDSVVGTFLSQNVSDHLSSSAYMNLAAKWASGKHHPFKPKEETNEVAPDKTTTGAVPPSEARAKEERANSASQSDPAIRDIEDTGGLQSKPDAGANEPDGDTWRCEEHSYRRERPSVHQDGVDWEAVRAASVDDIADAIKERGMQTMLAARIKSVLEKVKREHGSIDLECLRARPAEDARAFLKGLFGLGVKSAECILLLCLHQLAFPVDTNVGRICVRLGWVQLEPLDEEVQLHLLEQYPIQQRLQEYLWRRLSHLDQRELYELHYQLITFGKVFCTKRQPNCLACPMQDECAHYASAKAHKEQNLALSTVDPDLSQPLPNSPPTDSPIPLAKRKGRARKKLLEAVERQEESNAGKGHVHARAWFTEARKAFEQSSQEAWDCSLFAQKEASLLQAFSSLRSLVTRLESAPKSPVVRPVPRRLCAPPTSAADALSPRLAPAITCPNRNASSVSYPYPPFRPLAPRHSLSGPLSAAERSNGMCLAGSEAVTGHPPFQQRMETFEEQRRRVFKDLLCYPVADNRAALQQRTETFDEERRRVFGNLLHYPVANNRALLVPRGLPSPFFAPQNPSLTSEARLSPPLIEGVAPPQSIFVESQEGLGLAWTSSPRLLTPGTLGGLVHSPVDSSEVVTTDFGPESSVAPHPGAFNRERMRQSALVRSSEGLGMAWQTSPQGELPGSLVWPPTPAGCEGWKSPVASPGLATSDFGPMPQGALVPRALFPPTVPIPSFAANPFPSESQTPGWCKTGLPDLNLYPPMEETARELQAAVKGAAKDAKKRGVGRKTRPPTTFWALPLKRPEKLRTVRHAVRLPDDHPLLKEFGAREDDDPSPFFAVLWPASLVMCPPAPVPYAPDLSACPPALATCHPELASSSQGTGTWAPNPPPGFRDPVTCSPDPMPSTSDFATSLQKALPRRPSDAAFSNEQLEAPSGNPDGACHSKSEKSSPLVAKLQTDGAIAIPLNEPGPSIQSKDDCAPSNAPMSPIQPLVGFQNLLSPMSEAKESGRPGDGSPESPSELDVVTADQTGAAKLEPPECFQELENLADSCFGDRQVSTGHNEEPCHPSGFHLPGCQSLVSAEVIISAPEKVTTDKQRLKRPRSKKKCASWHLNVKRELSDKKSNRAGELKNENEDVLPPGKRRLTAEEVGAPEAQDSKMAGRETGLLTRSKKRKLEGVERPGMRDSARGKGIEKGNLHREAAAKAHVDAKPTTFLVAQRRAKGMDLAATHCRPILKMKFTKSILAELPVRGRQRAGFVERKVAKPGGLSKDKRHSRHAQSKSKQTFSQMNAVATSAKASKQCSPVKSSLVIRRVYETRGKAEKRKKLERLSIGERLATGIERRIAAECFLQKRKKQKSSQQVQLAGDVNEDKKNKARSTGSSKYGEAHRRPARTSKNRSIGFAGKPKESRARHWDQARRNPRKRSAAEVIDLSESDEAEAEQISEAFRSGSEGREQVPESEDEQSQDEEGVKNMDAAVRSQHDDVVPWPATPEKDRPGRPEANHPPEKQPGRSPEKQPGGSLEKQLGESARLMTEEQGRSANKSPVEEQPGEEGTCKCSTCSCDKSEATVFVTLLIPCRTAMSGCFPLNGTYFQTNELFADNETSSKPLTASSSLFAGLPRRVVYFGTSASNMFRGCSQEEIKDVFQRGYICVRGFDTLTRAPKPLSTRLHAATTVKKPSAPAML